MDAIQTLRQYRYRANKQLIKRGENPIVQIDLPPWFGFFLFIGVTFISFFIAWASYAWRECSLNCVSI